MCVREHAALGLASCTVHVVGNNLDRFEPVMSVVLHAQAGMCVFVWVCENHEHLLLSRGSLISVHAGTSPARSHPQLLYLTKGWRNHFH